MEGKKLLPSLVLMLTCSSAAYGESAFTSLAQIWGSKDVWFYGSMALAEWDPHDSMTVAWKAKMQSTVLKEINDSATKGVTQNLSWNADHVHAFCGCFTFYSELQPPASFWDTTGSPATTYVSEVTVGYYSNLLCDPNH